MSAPLLSELDEWTVEDLVALPDDGRRYEIVDGSLVVNPAPGIRHESSRRSSRPCGRPFHRAAGSSARSTSLSAGTCVSPTWWSSARSS